MLERGVVSLQTPHAWGVARLTPRTSISVCVTWINTMKGKENHYGTYIGECFHVLTFFRTDNDAKRLIAEIHGKPLALQTDALLEYYSQVFPNHAYCYAHFEKVADWLISEYYAGAPYGSYRECGVEHSDWWYPTDDELEFYEDQNTKK